MAGANGQHPGAGAGRLPEVSEGEASPEVQAVFIEIAHTVRVPYVGLFWRVLAADPPVLRVTWRAVAPNLRTFAAERAANRLRERALIEEAAGIASHKAFKGDLVRAEIDYDLRTRIANFNHVALYALPKHLLAAVMLSEALAGRQPNGGGDTQEIPLGVAPGAVAVAPLDTAAARSSCPRSRRCTAIPRSRTTSAAWRACPITWRPPGTRSSRWCATRPTTSAAGSC